MTTPNDLPAPTRTACLPFVTIIAATVGLLLPLAAVALLYWAAPSTSAEDEPSAGQKLRELQAAEERQLTTYDWVEKPAGDRPGVVRVPVRRARELVLKEM